MSKNNTKSKPTFLDAPSVMLNAENPAPPMQGNAPPGYEFVYEIQKIFNYTKNDYVEEKVKVLKKKE
jgi:hypothetical protein